MNIDAITVGIAGGLNLVYSLAVGANDVDLPLIGKFGKLGSFLEGALVSGIYQTLYPLIAADTVAVEAYYQTDIKTLMDIEKQKMIIGAVGGGATQTITSRVLSNNFERNPIGLFGQGALVTIGADYARKQWN